MIYQHATAERDGAVADALDRLVAGSLTLDGTLRALSPSVSLIPAVTTLMTSKASPPMLEPEIPRARRVALGASALAPPPRSAGSHPHPAVASGTGLFEVLGYGGLMLGSVLLLRVVAAVARDGTT